MYVSFFSQKTKKGDHSWSINSLNFVLQIDALFEKLSENMAEAERMIGEEAARQAAVSWNQRRMIDGGLFHKAP